MRRILTAGFNGVMEYRDPVRELRIRGDTIRLGQLLKLAGFAGSGAEAKALLGEARVTVNGRPEDRRGRQLHDGDVVAVQGEELRVSAAAQAGRQRAMLGLPEGITACLFDLDGVLTQTAKVHAAAWKQTFDEYLRRRAERTGTEFRAFDEVSDYDEYVDGLPRYDGVRTFLESRGIELPQGSPDDPPDAETIDGVGNRKNELVLRLIHERGVDAYEGSVRYVKAVREAGLRRAVVSSSANARDVLRSANMLELFEEIIDGNLGAEQHLKGKPAPDTFLAGARALGVEPGAAAVFEDALAGVEAGRAGEFGHVVGVDRVGQAEELRRHGADTVVKDLAELLDGSS
ncbi:MAG TPA: beta-phosphoglucomutase family hydrolase [Solirubrobacteraceae bacterium]|nr:beta-phosphoglucomutase family hydrolase [Solirubrobacteraceae bacterium]